MARPNKKRAAVGYFDTDEGKLHRLFHFEVIGNGVSFELEIVDDSGGRTAIVQMDGGQWNYQRPPNGGHEWLGGGRLGMGEVLKRAYEKLQKDSN